MRLIRNPKNVRVAIVYKNFAINKGISHIGLGVSALNNAKVLEKHGIKCDVIAASSPKQLTEILNNGIESKFPYTHMIISAVWISTNDLRSLIQAFPFVEFYVNSHSNIGFLQADPNALKLLREYADLEQGSQNFHISGNSKDFVIAMKKGYHTICAYLPNMYYIDKVPTLNQPSYKEGSVLRIGIFGAIRPQKNVITAAMAALELRNELSADTELYISGGRSEGGGTTIVNAVKQMIQGIPGIKLIEYNWNSWSQFRDTVRHMNLLLQMSYTESFNMVTADGIAEGVPSVVSEAINWVPRDWQTHFDSADQIARVGRRLIFDPFAATEGYQALQQHNSLSYGAWTTALNIRDCSGYRLSDADPFIR